MPTKLKNKKIEKATFLYLFFYTSTKQSMPIVGIGSKFNIHMFTDTNFQNFNTFSKKHMQFSIPYPQL